MIAIAICELGSLSERRTAMLVDPALSGLPAFLVARARTQLRFHDPAGHGGGARFRKQAASLSRERRLDPHERQPGRSCVDVCACRTPVDADGLRTPPRSSVLRSWRPRRDAIFTLRSRAATTWSAYARRFGSMCRGWMATGISAPICAWRPPWCARACCSPDWKPLCPRLSEPTS